jgi:hypothetical protein
MSVVEIESELKKMTNSERRIVIEIAMKLIDEKPTEKFSLSIEEKKRKLKDSAELMRSEYADNEDVEKKI